tara:strand:- start:1556 stop:3871 length:2316 start_codon:yes stop_codon:yes gene_type:complete
MNSRLNFLLIVPLSVSFFTSASSFAQNNESVEEIEVFADDLRYEIKVDRRQSANILGIEAIQQMQAADVFDTLESMPGLTIDGGLTTGGKSFSIRGFGDNEDVLVQIDGVTQNFEKYRAGTGVEIEPELLKEIAVFRGGTSVAQGAGYLGGVVQMETKDARDFLKDETFGATLRAGYKHNNDEKFTSFTAYALPFDGLDFLINGVQRKTNDLTRPNGLPFKDSDEQQQSLLAKTEFYTADSIISYSFRAGEDEGIEPYDLVSNSGVFSTLYPDNLFRKTEERAHSFRAQHNPANEWVELDFVLGYIDKAVSEQKFIKERFIVSDINPISVFQYDIWNFSLKNISNFSMGANQVGLTYGVQSTREKRQSKQTTIICGQAVEVEYELQPSGLKETQSVFMDLLFEHSQWRLRLGLRADDYTISPLSDGNDTSCPADDSPDNIQFISYSIDRFGADEFSFTQTTPALSVDRDWGASSWYYRYSEAFRAPLVTQYFSPSQIQGADGLGSCGGFDEVLLKPSLADYGNSIFNPQYIVANNAYINDANQQPYLLEANYFCGDVFRPEQSTTQEVGNLINWSQWLSLDNDWQTKITYFQINTRHLLSSLNQDDSGLITQPGTESRSGVEVEIDYISELWRTHVNFSTLKGKRTEIFEGEKITDSLRAPPGHALNILIERNLPSYDAAVGMRLRAVKSRRVDQNTGINAALSNAQYKRIPGYGVVNIYGRYQVSSQFSARVSVNNLFNKEYQLRGFGGDTSIGNVAAGRDIRVAIAYEF